MSLDFVALDLETADVERSSICEIGVTVVENAQIKESKSWLVQPQGNHYNLFNISLHRITPEMTKQCPLFPEVWKEVQPYLQGKVVVAHNTAFDMYALRDCFDCYNMTYPEFDQIDSYRLARKTIHDVYSYSLSDLCCFLGIGFEQEHRAESDSEACAKLFLIELQLAQVETFEQLEEKFAFTRGRFKSNQFIPQRRKDVRDYSKKAKLNVSDIRGNPDLIDQDNYFYGKAVCFTGTCQLAKRETLLKYIANIGGVPVNSVTKATDVLVVGQQDYRVVGESGMSGKQLKAMAMKDKGCDIEIMSEFEFIKVANMQIGK